MVVLGVLLEKGVSYPFWVCSAFRMTESILTPGFDKTTLEVEIRDNYLHWLLLRESQFARYVTIMIWIKPSISELLKIIVYGRKCLSRLLVNNMNVPKIIVLFAGVYSRSRKNTFVFFVSLTPSLQISHIPNM